MSEESPRIVTRFYRVVRIPIMIGRLPSGEKIIGGPYTAAQIVTVAAVSMLLYKSYALWRTDSLGINLLLAAGLVLGSGILAGKLEKLDGNPFVQFDGFSGAINSRYFSRQGTYRGKPLKFDKPARARARPVLINSSTTSLYQELVPEPAPISLPEPTPPEVQQSASQSPIQASSALKHLLAQTGTH